MKFSRLVLVMLIISQFSCKETIKSLTILHINIENENTGEPLADKAVIVVEDHRGLGEYIGSNPITKTNVSDQNGRIDFAFINNLNYCEILLDYGLSKCSEKTKIDLGAEQFITLQSKVTYPLIALHIDHVIDSIKFSENRCLNYSFNLSNYEAITNDTVIYFNALKNDTVYLSGQYIFEDTIRSIYQRIELTDQLEHYYIP